MSRSGRRVVVQRRSHSILVDFVCGDVVPLVGADFLLSLRVGFWFVIYVWMVFFSTCAKGLHGEGRQPRSVPLERALLLDLREKE